MKKFLLATAAIAGLGTSALADAHAVKVGVILGFTGPLESITPSMGASAELAFKEISDSGLFLDGAVIEPVRADSTCIDAAAATAAAERLVSAENVVAIMGADCSGVTTAIASNVAIPNGVVMVSPSATSPALSTIEDNGLFFRTAPSDARQGEVLANILADRDISEVAVTYTNNDYGKGLSDSFAAAFTAAGGTVTINAAHEDGKGDYSAEVGALAAAGGDVLVVLGYVDQGGVGIIRTSVDTGAFDTFVLGDGMFGQSLIDAIGPDLDGTFGTAPWSQGDGAEAFAALAQASGLDPDSTYTRESYDAGALIALAMAKGGEATREAVAANLLDVANAPGEPILPGELDKALEILAGGGDIDYVGATNVELIGPGEAAGTYREYEVKDGAFETVTFR
ncbi:ABC transporter substrate-binding protein [Halovulum dunhuangense]|uniref:ABC transporter substrate-binding protein n=1 Tax=Halovulum dunhuangense TaxID=1505036 RepID=A0A849L5I3_9RHOB|nr:ABC transporter substrate-binding protein [Halovulum dunhuangense]NNU81434.1 ABC transporter substrate-binding protein [Halovulum dunhuangense]